MRIFIGYHFDPQDQWVRELVYPIVQAFGAEVVHGENLYGEGPLGPAVTDKIKMCDALIGFATRRDKKVDNSYTTHRWVTDEIAQALSFKLKVVEVRELDVDTQGGIAAGCQSIRYNQVERDRCLVKLVEAIGAWHRQHLVKLQLLPEDYAQKIAPLVSSQGFRCVYQIFVEGDPEPSQEQPGRLIALQGGLFCYVRNVPVGAVIKVDIRSGAQHWYSGFESTSHFGIRLKEDP